MEGLWYAVLCSCTYQYAHGDIQDRTLTASMMEGTAPSSRATPHKILFFPESAYIRRAVNTGVYCQRVWL